MKTGRSGKKPRYSGDCLESLDGKGQKDRLTSMTVGPFTVAQVWTRPYCGARGQGQPGGQLWREGRGAASQLLGDWVPGEQGLGSHWSRLSGGSMEMSPFLVTGQEGEERGQRGIPRTTGAFPSSVLAPSLYGAVFWGALLPLAGSDLEGPLWAPLSLPPGCGQALAQACTLQRAGGVVLNK